MKCLIADISKYQGTVDWKAASQELLFCILRASIGRTRDSEYERNARACREYGVPFGAYHYCKAGTREDAEAEARVFSETVRAVEASPGFLAADIEHEAQTEESTEGVCCAFLFTLRALGHDKVGLYINQKYAWAGCAPGIYDFLWIPHWGKDDGRLPPEAYAPKQKCDIWQYTSRGKLAGVSGNVDLNALRGGKPPEYFTGIQEEEMAFDRSKVIAVAEAEIGYLEKKSAAQLDDPKANAGSGNYTKYARDMDLIPGFYNGRKQGAAWCDVFVDWCFVQAYGVDAGRGLLCQPLRSTGAGCKYSRRFYQDKGRLFTDPEPGDQVFFYPAGNIGGSSIQHTGLVVEVTDEIIVTIEGNTSGADGVIANGGGVCRKTYKRTYDRLAGFGRPDWGSWDASPAPTQPQQDIPAGAEEEPEGKTVRVVNPSGRKVNIRRGNGTDFTSIALLAPGALLEWVATAQNGWHAVVYKGQVGWISGSLSTIE